MSDMRIMGTPPDNYSVEQASTTRLGPEKGAPIDVRVLADGSVAHNIAFPPILNLSKGLTAFVEKHMKGLADQHAELGVLIADAKSKGMDGMVKDLENQQGKIERHLQTFKDHIEGTNNSEFINNCIHKPGYLITITKQVLDIAIDLDDAKMRISNTPGSDAPEATTGSAAVDEMKGSDSAEVSEKEGTSELGAKYIGMSDEKLMTHFSQNPESAWKEIASLPPGERGVVMQKLQMAVQADNQLQSMLTNFMKAMHDTAKGTISNLRV